MSEPSAKLDHNPLIVALANAITKLNTDSTRALWRWRNDRTVVDEINQRAKYADLTDSPVIEIDFEKALLGSDGWKHPDRWRIQFNHPVSTRNPITVHLGNFPPTQARAALPEIVSYLEAWQSAAPKAKPGKTKPTGKPHPRRKLTEPTPRQMEAYRLHVDQRLSGQDLADALRIKSRTAAWRLVKEAKRLINGKKRQSVSAKARYDETKHRS